MRTIITHHRNAVRRCNQPYSMLPKTKMWRSKNKLVRRLTKPAINRHRHGRFRSSIQKNKLIHTDDDKTSQERRKTLQPTAFDAAKNKMLRSKNKPVRRLKTVISLCWKNSTKIPCKKINFVPLYSRMYIIDWARRRSGQITFVGKALLELSVQIFNFVLVYSVKNV